MAIWYFQWLERSVVVEELYDRSFVAGTPREGFVCGSSIKPMTQQMAGEEKGSSSGQITKVREAQRLHTRELRSYRYRAGTMRGEGAQYKGEQFLSFLGGREDL